MDYKVVIDYGWDRNVYFYSTEEMARNVIEHAKKMGATAKGYMRSGLAWVLFAE